MFRTPELVGFDARIPSLSDPTVDYFSMPSDNFTIIGWNNASNISNTSVEGPPINLIHAIMAGTVLAIVVLMTIIGNVLVLMAVFVNSHLRSTTNYFIVNLAIADLLLGITVLPFSG